jgi:hypothetical protein
MFGSFPQSDIDIVAPDGTVRHRTKAIIDSKMATIPDPSIVIEPGDEIRRRIPSGVEEAFEVVDPVFYESHGGAIPAHYQVKIRRKGTFPKGTGGNYTFNVSGPNARVNFNSQDYSQNIVSDRSVFGELRAAIENGVPDPTEKDQLKQLVAKMEEASDDRGAFMRAYQSFIASAANHATVIGPFLPALSQMLG